MNRMPRRQEMKLQWILKLKADPYSYVLIIVLRSEACKHFIYGFIFYVVLPHLLTNLSYCWLKPSPDCYQCHMKLWGWVVAADWQGDNIVAVATTHLKRNKNIFDVVFVCRGQTVQCSWMAGVGCAEPLAFLVFCYSFFPTMQLFTLMKTWVILSSASEQNVVWSKTTKGLEQAAS